MKEHNYAKIQKYLTVLLGIMTAAVLIVLCIMPNINVLNTRQNEGYKIINDVSYREISDSDAPVGLVREFVFTADKLTHDETLMFSFNHQNAEVYIDGEEVYSLRTADELSKMKTSGHNWAMIPLYREDAGKEIKVLLMPIYSNYLNSEVEFMIGSKLAIYKMEFYYALPELLLSLCDVLIGLFLLGIGIYHSRKHNVSHRLYAVGTLAVSAGAWRITYGKFIYLLFENYSLLLYTISLVSLMFVALALLNCVGPAAIYESTEENSQQTGVRKAISKIVSGKSVYMLTAVYCILDIVQLILQSAGILDLRQMLKVTHGTIVLSAVILCMSSIITWNKDSNESSRLFSINYSWILAVGVIVDMLLYYFSDTTVGMLFTLAAIMCFSLLEGIKLLVSYAEQKALIEEMGMHLTLSRTTTMLSQIRSHFVFNILNAISGMCKYDPEKADETIVRFSRYLRNNIDIMESDEPVMFTTELAHLEDYVVLEQIRFGDKIEFYTDVQTDSFMIPTLILQPIVENAIKHGLTKKQEGGSVILRTRDEGENILITVEDDGVGFELDELKKEKSVGLKNISYRLRHLANGKLDIESRKGEGTKVTITLPKSYNACADSKMGEKLSDADRNGGFAGGRKAMDKEILR